MLSRFFSGKHSSWHLGRHSSRRRLFFFFAVAVAIALFVAPRISIELTNSAAQSPNKLKTQEEEIRQNMVVMSRQLGVTCTTCHSVENFKLDDKMPFKIAKEHMKITQALIDNGFDGKKGPKADCFMCHRGKLNPDHLEKINPLQK